MTIQYKESRSLFEAYFGKCYMWHEYINCHMKRLKVMQINNFEGNLNIRTEIQLFEFLVFKQDISVVVKYTYIKKINGITHYTKLLLYT
jgi:hypothetical protein